MIDLVEAKHVEGYLVELLFEDGKKGTVDLSLYVTRGGVFSRLADMAYFKRFAVNKELGVLCWPEGQDIAPETLYHAATGEPLPGWMREPEAASVRI